MYQGQPWHRYCKTSDNRVSRLIGPNGAYPDVARLSGMYCITISLDTVGPSIIDESQALQYNSAQPITKWDN